MAMRMLRCGAFLVALAAAATSHGAFRWLNDYHDAREAAKKTGRPIALVFGREGAQNVRLATRIFSRNPIPAFHRHFVFCYLEVGMANNTFSHGLFRKFPPGPGGHRFPLIFFTNLEEKILSQTEGSPRPTDLAFLMRDVLRKHGPIAGAKKASDMEAYAKRADALLEKKQFGPAGKLYKAIVDADLKLEVSEKARKQLAAIAERASKQLAAARTDIADKAYRDAVDRLEELLETYPYLEAGQEAAKELAKLRKLPEASKVLAEAEAASSGQTTIAEPELTTDPTDIENNFFTDQELDVLDNLDSAEQEAAAPPAKKAPSASAQCRRLLSLARSWIANKKPEKARELLQRIIDEHPTSLYADQAKMLLKSID